MRIPINHHTTATNIMHFPTSTLRAYKIESTLVVVTPNQTHFFPFHQIYPNELFYSDQFYYQKGSKVFSKKSIVSSSVYLFSEEFKLIEAGFCLVFRANNSTFLFKNGNYSKFIGFKNFKNPCFFHETEGEFVNIICVFDCFVLYRNNEALVIDSEYNFEYYEFKKGVVFIGYFINGDCNNNEIKKVNNVINKNDIEKIIQEETMDNMLYNIIDDVSETCQNFKTNNNDTVKSNQYKYLDNSNRKNHIDKIDENNLAILGTKSMVITSNAIYNDKMNYVNNNNYLIISDKIISNKSVINLLQIDEKFKINNSDDKYRRNTSLRNLNNFYNLRYEFYIENIYFNNEGKNKRKFEIALSKQSNLKEFINNNLEWIKNEYDDFEVKQFFDFIDASIIEKNIARIKNFDDFLLLKNVDKEIDILNNFDIFSNEKELWDVFYPRLHRQRISKVCPLIKDVISFYANEEDMENRRDKAHKLMLSARQSYLLKGEKIVPKMPIYGFDGAVECALSTGIEIKGVFDHKLSKAIFKFKSQESDYFKSNKSDDNMMDRNIKTSSAEILKFLDHEQQAGLVWGYAILNLGYETISNPGDDVYLKGIKKIAENFNTQNYLLANDLKEGQKERISAIVAMGLSFRNTKNKVIFEYLKEQANLFGVLNKEWVTEESRIISAFSMYLTGHVEFTILNDKLAELIYNGLAYFNSNNTFVKKRLLRNKEDRLEEIFYSSFFILGVDFQHIDLPIEYCNLKNNTKYNFKDNNSKDLKYPLKTEYLSSVNGKKNGFGQKKTICLNMEEALYDDLCKCYKNAGVYYYCGIYSILSDYNYINEWDILIDEIEELEKMSIKNKNKKVLFDASLVCASLIMNGTSNIRLLRILRRKIISYGDLNALNERTIFNRNYVTFYGNSYGDYLRYKLCVAVLCGRKLKKKLFEIFAAFYLEFPLEKKEQKFLRLFRHLMDGEGESNIIPNSLNEMGLSCVGLDYDLKVLIDDAAVRIENGEKVDLSRFGIFINE